MRLYRMSKNLHYDWDSLREDVKQYGVRNSTLSAQMPSESSSVVSNATNGIEPPRAFLSVKKSKKGVLKQIVPQYSSLKSNYTLLWDMESNRGYINIVAVMQKFFDQAFYLFLVIGVTIHSIMKMVKSLFHFGHKTF